YRGLPACANYLCLAVTGILGSCAFSWANQTQSTIQGPPSSTCYLYTNNEYLITGYRGLPACANYLCLAVTGYRGLPACANYLCLAVTGNLGSCAFSWANQTQSTIQGPPSSTIRGLPACANYLCLAVTGNLGSCAFSGQTKHKYNPRPKALLRYRGLPACANYLCLAVTGNLGSCAFSWANQTQSTIQRPHLLRGLPACANYLCLAVTGNLGSCAFSWANQTQSTIQRPPSSTCYFYTNNDYLITGYRGLPACANYLCLAVTGNLGSCAFSWANQTQSTIQGPPSSTCYFYTNNECLITGYRGLPACANYLCLAVTGNLGSCAFSWQTKHKVQTFTMYC
ncbi:hypothetical protein J6590_092976, partial [Homalodisca vitripennis]